jgi:hypothetical protein
MIWFDGDSGVRACRDVARAVVGGTIEDDILKEENLPDCNLGVDVEVPQRNHSLHRGVLDDDDLKINIGLNQATGRVNLKVPGYDLWHVLFEYPATTSNPVMVNAERYRAM